MEINMLNFLLELSPGFIGIAINNLLLGKTDCEKSYKKDSISFFMFTAISWIIGKIIVLIPFFNIWTNTKENFYVLLIFISIFISSFWTLKGKDKIEKYVNSINIFFNKNKIFLNQSVVEELTRDNKPHYWVVYKNNFIIAKGWFENFSFEENTFSLKTHCDDNNISYE